MLGCGLLLRNFSDGTIVDLLVEIFYFGGYGARRQTMSSSSP